MFRSRIHINLPSVPQRRKQTWKEWFWSLFGEESKLPTHIHALNATACTLLDSIVAGFHQAGIDDGVCFQLDDQILYYDPYNTHNDLDNLHLMVLESQEIREPFGEMCITVVDRRDDFFLIMEAVVKSEVFLNKEELLLDLVGYPTAFMRQPGETSELYAKRLKRIASAPKEWEHEIAAFEQIAIDIAEHVHQALQGLTIRVRPACIWFRQPTKKQQAHLRLFHDSANEFAARSTAQPTAPVGTALGTITETTPQGHPQQVELPASTPAWCCAGATQASDAGEDELPPPDLVNIIAVSMKTKATDKDTPPLLQANAQSLPSPHHKTSTQPHHQTPATSHPTKARPTDTPPLLPINAPINTLPTYKKRPVSRKTAPDLDPMARFCDAPAHDYVSVYLGTIWIDEVVANFPPEFPTVVFTAPNGAVNLGSSSNPQHYILPSDLPGVSIDGDGCLLLDEDIIPEFDDPTYDGNEEEWLFFPPDEDDGPGFFFPELPTGDGPYEPLPGWDDSTGGAPPSAHDGDIEGSDDWAEDLDPWRRDSWDQVDDKYGVGNDLLTLPSDPLDAPIDLPKESLLD